MSYSVSVTAATKDTASKAISSAIRGAVEHQPAHKADVEQAVSAGVAFIHTLPDPKEGENVQVDVCGSVSWNGTLEEPIITAASITINARLLT